MNILFSIISGLGFGFTLFFRKLCVSRIGISGVIFEAITEAILAVFFVSIIFPFSLPEIFSKNTGVLFGILAGISSTVGITTFFLAARSGPNLIPSVVTPLLTATTASLLAIFILKDAMTLPKLFGLLLALSGLFIFIRF